MAINKDFFIDRTTVTHKGKTVCDVRGITPDDLAQVMAENQSDMAKLLESWEKDKKFAGLNPNADADVARALDENATQMFTTILTSVPMLAAKLIALASDEPGSFETVKTWPIPLQFDILKEIAVLTFVDQESFKVFLGNVMALVGNVTGQRQMPMHVSQDGSTG